MMSCYDCVQGACSVHSVCSLHAATATQWRASVSYIKRPCTYGKILPASDEVATHTVRQICLAGQTLIMLLLDTEVGIITGCQVQTMRAQYWD